MNTAKAIKELMTQYNENKAKWIESKGSDQGFDKWFTKQVIRNAN